MEVTKRALVKCLLLGLIYRSCLWASIGLVFGLIQWVGYGTTTHTALGFAFGFVLAAAVDVVIGMVNLLFFIFYLIFVLWKERRRNGNGV